MAEAFLSYYSGGRFRAYSAGLEPGKLNPYVVKAMSELGIDISNNKTKSVYEFLDKGIQFDYVITVCDEANAERCPVFPGGGQRLHWGFPDPANLTGDEEEIMEHTRKIRDAIREKVIGWLKAKGAEYASLSQEKQDN